MLVKTLYYTGKRNVEIRDEMLGEVGPGKVLVKANYSAISSGTEILVYRGQIPTQMTVDSNIPVLQQKVKYPLKYGYAVVGEVIKIGSHVSEDLIGKNVFVFHPHQDQFIVDESDILIIPKDITLEQALFLPSMETAVNLVMDAAPLIGEKAVISGQGVVGLLTTALLSRYPLGRLITIEPIVARQKMSKKLGADFSIDIRKPEEFKKLKNSLGLTDAKNQIKGADLLFELSGNPAALENIINLSGFNSRIIVGSWYGTKNVQLDLGGEFHRNRIRLISSQVSTLKPSLLGRWTRERRMKVVWKMIKEIKPEMLISHRFTFSNAVQAYRLIDTQKDELFQVILIY